MFYIIIQNIVLKSYKNNIHIINLKKTLIHIKFFYFDFQNTLFKLLLYVMYKNI